MAENAHFGLNVAMATPGSAWAPVVDEWVRALRQGETPAATTWGGNKGPRSKLIHPHRLMLLFRGVAGTLLEERTGPAAMAAASGTERVALQLHRGVVDSLNQRLCYAPWAGLLVQRFCAGSASVVHAAPPVLVQPETILSSLQIGCRILAR